MSSARTLPSLQDMVQAAKGHYANRDLDKALRTFKLAVIKCSCNKTLFASIKKIGLAPSGIALPVCHCKDFAAQVLVRDNGGNNKLAMYDLAKKPCTCGSGITRCSAPTHIEALNGMAGVCEALKDYAAAYQYASMLVIIMPHAPEGYLRMAKVLKLRDAHQVSLTSAQCSWIYQQAMQSVRTHGDPNHEKLKLLGSVIRKDVLSYIPTELQVMVLQKLSQRDLCRAMRVSKSWHQACRNKALWRDLELVKRWPSPRPRKFLPGVLNDIISKRAQNLVAALTIKGLLDFGISHNTLSNILKASPALRDLTLFGSRDYASIQDPAAPRFDVVLQALSFAAPACLEALHLENFYLNENRDSPLWSQPMPFEKNLKKLSVINVEHPSPTLMLRYAVCPKLESLILVGTGIHRRHYSIDELAKATPALKYLVLDNLRVAGFHYVCPAPWHALESFAARRWRVPLPILAPKLRSLDFNLAGGPSLGLIRQAIADSSESHGQRLDFSRLEHFGCVFADLDRWHSDDNEFSLLQSSCDRGTLRSLHVTFSERTRDLIDQVLTDKGPIETLSCHNIQMPSILDIGRITHAGLVDEFLDWVATFPNLTTVGVFPEKTDHSWLPVAKLMRQRPEIKTIYTDGLRGVKRDEVLKWAEKDDITIIHASRVPEPELKPLPACDEE